MLRTILLVAGLSAALILGGVTAVRGETTPDSNQTAWAEQHVQDITPGQVYRLEGCFTVTDPGLTYASLRISWLEEPDGHGSALYHEEAPANPSLVGVEQCLSIANADAPCVARSARYGLVVKGEAGAVEVSSLSFSLEPLATPTPCPTPTPTPTPQPTPTLVPQPTPTPTLAATPSPEEPAPTAKAAAEPAFFPSLVNGGFEDIREDGTPHGWRKIGGEMSATTSVRAEGERSAALTSQTESTKWLYQTVAVKGGSYYRLEALALKSDLNVREVLLRVSWYESADGSGSQIATSDSDSLAENSPAFAALDTGPVQAPPEARSAKVRLLLRPASAAPAVVYFDDVRFLETSAPPSVAGAGSEGGAAEDEPSRTGLIASGSAEKPPPPGALSAWAGPTPLANVRQDRTEEAAAGSGGGGPLWPVLLAIGIPTVGLSAMAGNAWWRTRLAEGKRRHL